MVSSSSSFVTLAGFSGSHLMTIRPFLPPNSQSKITPFDVETPLSPSYGGVPTNVKTYPLPVLLTITASTRASCRVASKVNNCHEWQDWRPVRRPRFQSLRRPTREPSAEIVHDAYVPRMLAVPSVSRYWHGIGPVLEIE